MPDGRLEETGFPLSDDALIPSCVEVPGIREAFEWLPPSVIEGWTATGGVVLKSPTLRP